VVGLVVKKTFKSCESRLQRAGKRQTVYEIIHHLHELNRENLAEAASRKNIDTGELKEIISELRLKGLIYSPKPGTFTCVD
jgi:hypothetical protein